MLVTVMDCLVHPTLCNKNTDLLVSSGDLMKWFIQIKVAGDLPINQYSKFLLVMVDTLIQELVLVLLRTMVLENHLGICWWHNPTFTDSDSIGLGWSPGVCTSNKYHNYFDEHQDWKITKLTCLLLLKMDYTLYLLRKWKGKEITWWTENKKIRVVIFPLEIHWDYNYSKNGTISVQSMYQYLLP